jgi:hypothetical protein
MTRADTDLEHLGTTVDGDDVFYDADRHSRVHGHADAESVTRDEEVSLDQDTSVGQVVREMNDERGWSELSDYAKEHAPDVAEEIGPDDAGESDESGIDPGDDTTESGIGPEDDVGETDESGIDPDDGGDL